MRGLAVRFSTLFLAICAVAQPAAAADFGFFGLDIRGGATFPTDWDTGYVAGVSVNVARLADGLYLYPAVSYSAADQTEEFFGSSFDLKITDLAVGVEVRYFLDGEPTGFYFGGGPYLNSLDEELVIRPFPGITVKGKASSDEVGAVGVAGYKWRSFLAEARYSGVSGFNAFQLLVGFSFDR